MKLFSAGIFIVGVLVLGFLPGQGRADEPAEMALGELSHLLKKHPAHKLPKDIHSLDVLQVSLPVDDRGLLPDLVPARSTACSILSVVNTPKVTGTPESRLTEAIPLETSALT